MIKKLFSFFGKRQRKIGREIDMTILFPKIKSLSDGDDKKAYRAILFHVSIDNAWSYPDEYNKDESKIVKEARDSLQLYVRKAANKS